MEPILTAAGLHAYAKNFTEAYDAAIRPLSAALGLPQTAVDILLFLANNPDHATAKDICAMRHLKPGMVSLHVDALCRQGFLERQSVPGDRRKLRLVPTAQAAGVIAQGRSVQAQFAASLSQGLSAEDLERLTGYLETIADNMNRLRQSPPTGHDAPKPQKEGSSL